MPSHQWDPEICEEYVPVDGNDSVERSERAQKECQKRLQAYLEVRKPQEKLDDAIVKLVSSPDVSQDRKPLLYFGILCKLSNLEACIVRNGLEINSSKDPIPSNWYNVCARTAVQRFLQLKCGFYVFIKPVFSNNPDFQLVGVDATDMMRYIKYDDSDWNDITQDIFQTVGKELSLDRQQPKWWWSFLCGIDYVCPLLEYNPPQISEPIKEMQEYYCMRAGMYYNPPPWFRKHKDSGHA